jgi:hypothetical protein
MYNFNIRNINVDFYPETKQRLNLIRRMNNICIMGNSYSGKREIIHSVYQINKQHIKKETFEFSKKKEYNVLHYRLYYEINCSDLGYYDKHILNHITKEIANAKHLTRHMNNEEENQKTILCIRNIHLLSIEAQNCLRGIIDKYSNKIHFIYTSTMKECVPQSLISRQIQFSIGEIRIEQDNDIRNILEAILPSSFYRKLIKNPNMSHLKSILNRTFEKNDYHILKTILNFRNIVMGKEHIISREEYYEQKISDYIDTNIQNKFTFERQCNLFRNLMYEMMRIQFKNEEILELLYKVIQNKINTLSVELIELWNEFNAKFRAYYRSIFIFELFWLKAKKILIKNLGNDVDNNKIVISKKNKTIDG